MHWLRTAVLAATWLGSLCAQDAIGDVVRSFAPFDLDGDGRAEVRSLACSVEAGESHNPLVVVFVEKRLFGAGDPTVDGEALARLDTALRRFAQDLANDGFRAVVLDTEVHTGPPHQDGRTVLALRRLLQRLHATAPLAGAILVGHFPDALLVRTCNWRRNETLSLPGKDGKPVAFDGKTTNVRCVPEIVAHRCDVVLADLDGDWERVYVPGPSTLASAWAVFGDTVPAAGGPCVALQTGELAVADVFHVRDGAAIADGASFTLHLDAADRDRECSVVDRALGNPLAQPDISVSRIDARGVAWSPEEGAIKRPLLGSDFGMGEAAFEARPAHRSGQDGKPAAPIAWSPDPALERRLLLQYFDRNHAFRTAGRSTERHRPASIAHELGSGMASLCAADPAWATFVAPGYDVHQGASLVELLHWLQRPAVLRTLRAHSDPWGAAFAATDPDALTKELGVPWHWVKDGLDLVPSWREHRGGRADFVFYRALHDKQVLRDNPYLLVHTGCEAVSPPHAVTHAYDAPEYGQRAHAESILFFTPCVAMVGRAKVFYDDPRGFCEALGEGKTVGDAWRRYFAIEGAAANWAEVGDDIGRKRAYFWSVLGDWTLRLSR